MFIYENIFDNCSCSLKIIYITIWLLSILYSILEEKIAENFEKMMHLKCNLPIFGSLNLHIRLFIYVSRHDCVMNMAGLQVFSIIFY